MTSNKFDNLPHYHIWTLNRSGEMIFRRKRMTWTFNTKQQAHRIAKQYGFESGSYMVLQCWDRKCKPKPK
ncbi:MAG: hypothetical protein OXH65_03750 [Paracoccaceae bacterium]|nr:hypothetical protein [Paracoccaceae bacterium]